MLLENTRTTYATFEAFTALPEHRDFNFELVDGEIIEKMPSLEHGVIASNLSGYFWNFCKGKPGCIVAVEVRHKLPNDDHNARQPDISVFTNADEPILTQSPVPRMPDIAIEVQSPDDTLKAMREKAAYYLANGTQMVILVFTRKRFVEVQTADNIDILTLEDTLEGGAVLPEFSLSVKDIFPA
jgi:Uma2 family endonuclease